MCTDEAVVEPPVIQMLMTEKDVEAMRSDQIKVNTIDVEKSFAKELENQLCEAEKPVNPLEGVEETGNCLSPIDPSIVVDAGVPARHRFKECDRIEL